MNTLPVRHPELYTLVEMPGEHVSRHRDPVKAQRLLDSIRKTKPGSYLLPPGTTTK